jgi:hypothetical protein
MYLQVMAQNKVAIWLDKAPRIFGPVYFGWPRWIGTFSHYLAIFCAVYWLVPVRDRLGRMASLVFALLCAYNMFIPVLFPWYLPPIAMCGIVALTRAPFVLAATLPGLRLWLQPLACAALTGIVLEMAALTFFTTWEMKIDQAVIENGNRKQVGFWLKDHAHPNDLVYLESLGYIGYFSAARVADFPGLISPAVVHYRRDLGLDFYSLIPYLKPDWIVVRPSQREQMLHLPFIKDSYHHVRTFDVVDELKSRAFAPSSALLARFLQLFDDRPRREDYTFVPGRSYMEHDATFLIFERNRK